MADIRIAWGQMLGPNGRLVHVGTLPPRVGRSCGLICPDCGTPLVAKQGGVVRWHFAHGATTDCRGETVLHKVAKQVLVDAARDGRALILPGCTAGACSHDVLGIEHQGRAEFLRQPSKIFQATSETPLDSGQVADVLLCCEALDMRLLVVEIHVTHAKSGDDIEKFRAADLDALEIDLSGLKWDASVSEIEDAVLNSAPRCWLHALVKRSLPVLAQQNARQVADEATLRYQQHVEGQLTHWARLQGDDLGTLPWPKLTSMASGQDSAGRPIDAVVERSPRLDFFPPEWRLRDWVWRATSTVRGVSCDTVIVMALPPDSWRKGAYANPLPEILRNITRPTLIIQIHMVSQGIADQFRWVGIQRWRDRLEALAQEKLAERIDEAESFLSPQDLFVKEFRTRPPANRMAYLCQRLSVSIPAGFGPHDPAWNTPRKLWRRLVWLYAIAPEKDYISTDSVAGNDWLRRLLDYSQAEEAFENRRRSMWFFLKDLETQGLVRRTRRPGHGQCFDVITDLNAVGWQDWMDGRPMPLSDGTPRLQ